MSYEQHVREAAAARGVAGCAVVTLSDTRTLESDKSGQRIRELLIDAGHEVVEYRLVKDEPAALDALLSELLTRADVDVNVTSKLMVSGVHPVVLPLDGAVQTQGEEDGGWRSPIARLSPIPRCGGRRPSLWAPIRCPASRSRCGPAARSAAE